MIIDDLTINRIKEIGSMAYGSREGWKGGNGNIGISPNGHVFKFNTHYSERKAAKTTNEMCSACNTLRLEIMEIARKIYGEEATANLTQIAKKLGLSDNGKVEISNTKLLNRKVVAKIVSGLIDEVAKINGGNKSKEEISSDSEKLHEHVRVAANSSKGQDTTFLTQLKHVDKVVASNDKNEPEKPADDKEKINLSAKVENNDDEVMDLPSEQELDAQTEQNFRPSALNRLFNQMKNITDLYGQLTNLSRNNPNLINQMNNLKLPNQADYLTKKYMQLSKNLNNPNIDYNKTDMDKMFKILDDLQKEYEQFVKQANELLSTYKVDGNNQQTN